MDDLVADAVRRSIDARRRFRHLTGRHHPPEHQARRSHCIGITTTRLASRRGPARQIPTSGPAVGPVPDPDPAAVGLDERPRHEEADARPRQPCGGLRALVEEAEGILAGSRRKALPSIEDLQADLAVDHIDAHLDRGVGRAVPQGVGDEVAQEVAEVVRVATHGRDVRVRPDDDHRAIRRQRRSSCSRLGRDVLQEDRARVPHARARRQPDDREQVLDESVEMLGLGGDVADDGHLDRAGDGVPQQQLRSAVDRGDGRSELVRQARSPRPRAARPPRARRVHAGLNEARER